MTWKDNKQEQQEPDEGLLSEQDVEEMSVSRMTQLLLGNDPTAAAAAAAGAGPIGEPQAAAEEESESEVSDDAPRLMARRPRRRS